MGIDTKERDLGYKKILNEFKAISKKPYVKVGFVKDESHDDGTSLITIATSNEFGTETIPERSFMRSTADEQKRAINNMITKGYGDIVKGSDTVLGVLKKVGLFARGKIQEKITTVRKPANDPKTISKKGSSNPLIDTGLMRSSVREEVVKDGRSD